MTKHTPGPWIYSRNGKLIYILGDWNPAAGTYADVAEIAPQDEPEAQANARLIAAAPKMLAALQQAEKALDAVFDGWVDSLTGEALFAVRAAIAEVEGEKP